MCLFAYHLQPLCMLFSEGPLFIVTNPPLRYYVTEGVRLYSGDLEGGHTDQESAASTLTSEWVIALQ